VRRKFRVERSRGKAVLLKLPESRGESREGGLTELDQRLLESRVDGVRLPQHNPRRVTLTAEIFEPAAEARFENRAWAEESGVGGGRVQRFEGTFGSVVKLVENGEQNAFFAVEVQVERASCNTRPRDDVRDACPPVAFAGKDPRCGIEQLTPPGVWGEKRSSIVN
jgi:hypothetical protein